MTDIDPAFTLGRLAADRDRLLRLLAAEGLLDRQAALARPARAAAAGLVTSAGGGRRARRAGRAAAVGPGVPVLRADVRVQGRGRPGRWPGACGGRGPGVDVVLLVRGGGATTDLAAFDSEAIARAVAGLDVPVLTGIGHDIDRSVADEVAHAPTRRRPPAPRRWWPTCGRSSGARSPPGGAWRPQAAAAAAG